MLLARPRCEGHGHAAGIEGQGAAAVLLREPGGGAAQLRLSGRVAAHRGIRVAAARIVGLQEGAVHKAFGDYREEESTGSAFNGMDGGQSHRKKNG